MIFEKNECIKIVWGVKNHEVLGGKNFVRLLCALLALFGKIRCAFEFRIISTSVKEVEIGTTEWGADYSRKATNYQRSRG